MPGRPQQGSAGSAAAARAARCTLFVLMALAGCATVEVREERLIRFMDEMLFGGPYDAHHEQDKRVARWRGEMRVAITGQQAEDYRDALAEEVARMADLSGVDARMASSGEDETNVVVELVEERDFVVNREYADCYAHLEGDDHHIDSAKVYIGMARPEGFQDCAAHELMHVFGFRFHSGILRSVMSPAHGEDELTEWDELAFKVLYDPRLELGAPRDVVMPIIRQVIRENRIGN
ncbi:MAG: DUF2927 domain-containing protein [Rhodospirillales bacterium]|nr:DUF2927 domain-containing protein [Rhodospirillales bacterium]MDH3917921.1 DUF2927 domain-containing protein [Rhodospirillales bacterium]